MGQGYTIRNKAAKAAEILIYEDIGEGFFASGVTAAQFVKDLKALGQVDTIDVRINSYGGNVADGTAIYNALVRHGAKIVAHIDGMAASIASVIAMAGSEIRMAENAWIMVHDAWGMAIGNAADLRQQADLMDSQSKVIADVYAARTGQPLAKVRDLMAAETWMSADEAIKLGFANSMTENMRIAAYGAPAAQYNFRHLPSVLGGSAANDGVVPSAESATLRQRSVMIAQRARLLKGIQPTGPSAIQSRSQT
jgi:ATP-dependent Clp protease protease subunit